ncbi:PLC-like phosphodiesterase [Hypoxylon sp. NC1633]|nr:PLC-like phosphodiesterase [Hypoxylon sp. NC1633]
MAIDSKASLTSHPPLKKRSVDKLHPSIAMSDEQTPLLDAVNSPLGNSTPAGIPAPGSRSHSHDDIVPGSRRVPQTIAHRGYKVVAPENSMLAFRAAVEVGAHAVETDLHLSKDGVVVLSHDGSLKRCFGEDAKVRDHDWSHLSTLRTLRKPEQPMARLLDLLEFLNQPALQHVWIMLDIKTDDDATEMMRRTAETIASVPGIRPWSERILPCCWKAQYIKLCKEYLPKYRVANVGFSTTYSRAIAANVPDASISMLHFTLALPFVGQRFIRDMKRAGHPLHVWTVNEEDWMEWSIRKELDGVITDDPKLFLEVCRRATNKNAKSEAAESTRNRSIARFVARKGRACFEWSRFFFFLTIITVIYGFRNGLPRTSVRRTFET